MRQVLLVLALLTGSVAEAGVAVGLDGDLALAAGANGGGGTGGGAGLRVGWATPMVGLGPMGFQMIPEVAGTYHQLRRVEGSSDTVRGTAGVRIQLTVLWLRRPDPGKAKARGIRLNTGLAAHGGLGTLDVSSRPWSGTGDASLLFGVGLGPVDLGAHVGLVAVGVPGPSSGATVWVSAGANATVQF